MIDRIKELSNEYTKDCAQFLRDMIAIPSTSCNEKEVVQRIKQEMEKIGYDEVIIDPMGNILGRIGTGKRIIAFDAHVDTVDVGDPSLWKVDPFKGKLENGIIYGRGASDMEGGMAAMTYAGKILKQTGIPDDVTVYVVGSIQEEDCDGLCWQYIVNEDKIRPDLVVITEPTNLNIYRGHRGRMEFEVETKGVSCHGSAPERGVNAVYHMADIVKEVEELNERLHVDDFLGKGTITISHIRSTAPSLCSVADSCTIHLDRRLTAGETDQSALDEIRNLPSFKKHNADVRILEYDTPSYTGLSYPTRKYYPTWHFEENHFSVRSSIKAYQKVFNKEPHVDKWTFSTNGVATAGMYGIPTVGFGPANEIYAHSPDDQCPVDDLTKAMMFYAALVWEF